ncbi:alpha/beta-hydrolase [Penicillium taxi]|uniref:alpha/beta-hydrolase n=1 Tax=Penicillium taxi TaxID=168475 RepID=UPI002544E1BE|nr:alpha/beta-hydrolase [Penicillium taxi]KAJ5894181.1 alpha/beta-hydrolase [Penicillium taxi]
MAYPEPHIHNPTGAHTHTFVFLHGSGSSGPEFCEEMFSMANSKMLNLPQSLPTWRWVFPSASVRWRSRFEQDMPVWFDYYSLEDTEEKKELQLDGLRESVSYILNILEQEIERIGDPSRVILGGISLGMATALWTLLCAPGRIEEPLGGVVCFCGWLPFVNQTEDLIQRLLDTERSGVFSALERQRQVSKLFFDTLSGLGFSPMKEDANTSVLLTPMFLSHGVDDGLVPIEHGRRAAQTLKKIDIQIEWNEFSGAEANGHWIKEPQGLDQIMKFIEDHIMDL